MKRLLILSAWLGLTIIALAPLEGQDTVARTRTGAPVVNLPRSSKAEERKFEPPSATPRFDAYQRTFPPQNPNWVDTITVGRLPTGSCRWSTVRIRPGKRGTMSQAGEPIEKTCTVLVYNYTTGSSQDLPGTVAFGYREDHKVTLPKGAIVHFADTFTVARKPNGNCDWSKTPLRAGRPGSGSTVTETRVKDCWGVVTNYTSTVRQDTTGMKADTQVVRGPSDTQLLEDMKATGDLLKKAHVSENDVVRTSRGSANAEIVVRLRRGEAHYWFTKSNGVWAITKVDTTPPPR
jgi:hypothetical protein